MPDIDPIILQLRADVTRYRNELRSTTILVEDSLSKQERAVIDLETRIRSSSEQIGGTLKGLAATIAGAFSVREVIGMAESFTRVSNQLRTAGLAGRDLTAVQDRLFDTASRYGAEVEAIATTYGRTAQVAGELGASQEDLLAMTEAVSAAVRVQGGSASAASGALLQLSQALGGGTVRAEEFNSINEALLPLLQAVARNMDGMGGSVARLRKAVMDGEVSSQAFFRAIVSARDDLDQMASRSVPTLANALTSLRNELIRYVGTADQSAGATATLAVAIQRLADNIDTIAPAIAAIGLALGVGWVTRMTAAAAAARGVGGALMGAFGGPIGIAITAVTLAIGSFASEAIRTRAQLDSLSGAVDDAEAALERARNRGKDAKEAVAGVGKDASDATPKVTKFAGAVGDAADQLYRMAKARQADALSNLEEKRRQASIRFSELYGQSDRGLQDRARLGRGWQGGISGGLESVRAGIMMAGKALGFGASEDEIQSGLQKAREEMSLYDASIRETSASLERFGREIQEEQEGAGRAAAATARGIKATGDAAAAAAEKIHPFVKKWMDDLKEMESAAERTAELEESLRGSGRDSLSTLRVPIADPWGDAWQAMEDRARAAGDAMTEINREQAYQQEQNLRNLSGLYYDLFSQNSENIWDNFKRLALQQLAEIAAEQTMRALSSAFGDGVGAVFGAIFGRASGGMVGPNSLTRVNEHRGGVELLRIGSGKSAQVIPLGQANAAAQRAQPVVVQVQVEEGALFRPVVKSISEQTAAPIAANISSQMVGAGMKAVMDGMPQRMVRYQRDGT